MTGPAAPMRRGTWRMPGSGRSLVRLGMLPFLLFVAVFLGGPLYVVIHGAFTTENNQLTLNNFSQVFSQAQYTQALKNSLILSLWTAVFPALFGLWLAAAVAAGNPNGILNRVVRSGSYTLAYFGGLPLAFTWIATVGPLGVLTVLLKSVFGFDLTDHFNYASVAGVGIVYFFFQIPIMVLLMIPALEGLRPEWDEAARNLGASRREYLRLVVAPVLAPSVIGATLMLFGSAFSAFATAYALDGGTLVIVPGRINLALTNNVLQGQDRIAMALGTEMIVVVLIVIAGYWVLQRRARRWLK